MRSRLYILAIISLSVVVGQPSFNAHDITTSADGARDVFAIDLDQDGDIDVLSASEGDDKIVWYENNGSESFTAHTITTFSDGTNPQSVYAVDVDSDGDIDVLSGSEGTVAVAWYENNGSESFTAHTIATSSTASHTRSVHAADVDGDGDMDVLSASVYDDKINWYENNGSESFTAHTITTAGDQARDVYAIDLDNDGDIDVVSASWNDNKVSWSENNGSESFTTHTITSSAEGVYNISVADVDSDGDLDVLSSSGTDGKTAWYENNGSESFTAHTISTSGAWETYVVDLDSDGDMDVLSAPDQSGFSRLYWYENNGSESFTAHTITTSDPVSLRAVYAIDVDGDGDIDLLTASESNDKITWYENTMDKGIIGSWTAVDINTSAEAAVDVFAVDLDSDGDMDVLSALEGDDKIAWYENNGSQSFTARTIATSVNQAYSVYAVDLDTDGDMDVLSASYADNKIAWYENNGSESFTARTITTNASSAWDVYAVDLDSDGDMDVLSVQNSDPQIAWYENNGSQSFTARTIATSAYFERSVYAVDLDKDGDMDVLAASNTRIAWYENNGSESFTFREIALPAGTGGPNSVYAVDLDSDGDMDVLSASYADDKIAWYENNGSQSFTARTIATSANGAQAIYAEDLDKDGDMDVLSASYLDNKIAWYENNGSESFTARTISTSTSGAYDVYAVDLDSDGDMDVLAASWSDNKITWYENNYDAVIPSVSSVSSTNNNGTYKIGDDIAVTVVWSEAATVTGTPRIKLETGTTDQYATYASGSTTTTLTFNYTVAAGDTTADLDYTSTSALELNSGTIKDASGNAATLTLASPGASGSLGANKAIVIDGNVPTVVSVTSTKTNRGYTVGTTIPITITFNQAVTVTGTPQLTLETGTTDAVVDYASGTGTATLTFNYVVAAGHNSSDLDYECECALRLNSGTIKDASGNIATLILPTTPESGSLGTNKALIIDTTGPTVSTVSSSKNNAAYKVGELIPINVNFDDKVFVTGTPQLTLETGPTDAVVDYSSGSESTTLTFNYTVASTHNSSDLDYTSSSALTLNSGTVKDSLGNVATLTLPAPGATGSLGANKAIIIDNLPPVLSFNPVDGSTAVLPTLPISINFNEYVRLLDNTELTSTNVDALIALKDTDASGTDIPFDATINSTKTVITIDPTADFASEQNVYVAISASLEDTLDHATAAASATLKMKDVIVPTVTFDPTNGSSDVPGNRNITLTFSEAIRNIDNSEITESNIAGLIDLKGNNASGADFNFGATINADKTVITVDPLFDFSASSVVYVGIGAVVEDDADNAIVATSVLYITGIPDVIGPAVSNVTSANADSSYKNGSSIIITISFNEVAIVTGTPQLTLETGTTDGVANYSSGSGTKDLYFTYNVTSDHNTAHLDYKGSNALTKNGGTIKDFVGNSANLALPNPGAENSLGANKTIVIDHFIPVISLVAEGTLTGEDKDYQTVATTMDISWAGTDTISGISKYEYALGTTSGGTEVKTWTDAATVTSVSLSGLSLGDGSKYYASVKATDKANNVSVVKTGDGITIDITAPTVGTISDGTVADISFTASSNSLYAKWTGFSDANSGISNYVYAIGTTTGGTDTKNWTSNGIDTTVTVTILTLTSGQVYYISVRATDLAGNVSSVITTNGVTVDLAGPIKGTVLDGLTADADWTTNTDTIRASWTGFTDPLSGIKKYQYGIGKSSGASDVVDWTDNSLDTTITLKLTLEEAVTYYVSVRGVDKVDNIGEVATSDGITADFTPPTIVSASIEDNATLPILSDSEIIFTISEPITAATSTTESKLGDSATGTLTLDDATQISVKLANPFTSGDELTLTINDLKDRSGNVTSNLVYNYNIALIADYNVDGFIDAADLTVLLNGWTNKDYAYELGPAAGDVPNLKPATDGKYDIMDAAVLIRMWHWNLNKSGKMRARYYVNTGKDLTYSNENSGLSIQVSKDVNAIDLYFDYPQDKVSIKQVNESSSEKVIILSHLDTLNGEFFITAGYFEPKLQSVDLFYIIKGKEDVTITAMYRMFNSRGEVFSQGTKEITLKPIPQEFALHQNYPNPFNPVTTINYDLPQQTHVNLMIYDILGREVVKLVSKEIPAGYQSVIWNTRNNFGQPVSAGIYFYQIQTKGFVKTRKMVLLK